MYVESNCNDDMAIFSTSGFSARAKKSASGPMAVPTFKYLACGTHPGEIQVAITSVPGRRERKPARRQNQRHFALSVKRSEFVKEQKAPDAC
jgi:hypothetical protein